MIETLILGFVLGVISTGAGAAYAAWKFINRPYVLKKLSDGCTIFVVDKKKYDTSYHMFGIADKSEKIIGGIKFINDGVLKIVADGPKHAIL